MNDVPVPLVVTSVLTSADVSLTSGNRSPDETHGTVGSVTQSLTTKSTSVVYEGMYVGECLTLMLDMSHRPPFEKEDRLPW